ncbi:hypothetical protein ACIBEK_08840 [Nocardia fusca]|uniref:hypothetical protein n=1 Tax=Nocardia fusca TaxID=941183 RepID=UPI0037A7215E
MTAEPTPAPLGHFVRWAVPVVSCLALATLAAQTRPFGWAATALVAAPSIPGSRTLGRLAAVADHRVVAAAMTDRLVIIIGFAALVVVGPAAELTA